MLGAKLGQVFGSLRVLGAATLTLMIAALLVTFSPNAIVLILGQLLAGLAAAVIVPTLVVLIANNYRGKQQATCPECWGRCSGGDRDRLFHGRGDRRPA
ncbi:MAG: hypothetical protein U0802_15770 [Candidatus Binatia bacterium]